MLCCYFHNDIRASCNLCNHICQVVPLCTLVWYMVTWVSRVYTNSVCMTFWWFSWFTTAAHRFIVFAKWHHCALSCDAFHAIISSPGERRDGRGRAAGCQSHPCLERQVVHCAACSSWNLTRACCQRHATATKAYNWASAISWPSRWTAVSFVTSEKLVAWSVCV